MYWKIGVYNFCITSSQLYFSVYYIKVFQSLLLTSISFVANILASLKHFLTKQRACPETDQFFSAGFRYTILSCNIIYRNNQISILIWCSLSYTVRVAGLLNSVCQALRTKHHICSFPFTDVSQCFSIGWLLSVYITQTKRWKCCQFCNNNKNSSQFIAILKK